LCLANFILLSQMKGNSIFFLIFKIRNFSYSVPVVARSAAARLLRLRVKTPPGVSMFICCVLSGRGLCDETITRPEESYRLCCLVLCDL
jgi:hypothetical protein